MNASMQRATKHAVPRILVVDDNPAIREMLDVHLRNAGYEVIVAEDAIVAGTIVLQRPPDVMILDIKMPYIDGLQFASIIKADKSVPFFPVIFLTGSPEAKEEAEELGAECLCKPVKAERLFDAVARHLARATAHPEV
jgi:DNA-binding response OmpR family regulator